MKNIVVFHIDTLTDCRLTLRHSGSGLLIARSYEEIEGCEKNSLVILRVADIDLASVKKTVDLRKKRPDCSLIVCCERLDGDYHLFLNELGISHRMRKEIACDCCLEEIDFAQLAMRVFRSTFGETLEADPLLRKVAAAIMKGPPELRLRSIANTLDISPDHLSRSIKKKTGIGFRDLTKELKFRIAEEMMSRRTQTIEIAEALGYTDKANFYRFFRNMTGMNPNRYAESIQEAKPRPPLPSRPLEHCHSFCT